MSLKTLPFDPGLGRKDYLTRLERDPQTGATFDCGVAAFDRT